MAWRHSSARSDTRTDRRTTPNTTRKKPFTCPRRRDPSTSHGVVTKPCPLGGEPVTLSPDADRREKLADWLVSPSNPFFARAAVNRIWYHLLGRGIVEPVDDLRESNPPASAELLNALADDFTRHGYNVQRTIRLIISSRIYQTSSQPNRFNAEDTRYFSHATVRMLSAEQMLDSASCHRGHGEALQPARGITGSPGAGRRARPPVPEGLRPACEPTPASVSGLRLHP